MRYKLFVVTLLSLILLNCKKTTTSKDSIPIKETTVQPALEATLLLKHNALLGEGAYWDHPTQTFYWVDIEGKMVHLYNPATNNNRSFPTPSRIGTVVPQNDTTAIVALEDGVYTLDTKTGDFTVLSDVEKEMTINRFNDGKCDPLGNLWVGSMHLEQTDPMGSVYKISEEGKTTKMIDSVTISNGIVWTKDATTMYYIDTPTGTIQAYDFDADKATISNKRTAVIVDPSDGFPDGMTIDENDQLWVGLWNGNAVAHYDPISGTLIQKIAVPAHNVTACAFGGEDFSTLYITTASVDMTDEEKETYPLAGSLFVATPGVKGVSAARFGVSKLDRNE